MLTTGALLGLIAAAGPQLSPLFVLGRSKNANVVVYSARLGADGQLDPKAPLDAHWLMKAENGREEPLNELEKKLAYGFSFKEIRPGKEYLVTLNAFKERPLTVMPMSGGYRAVARINGVTSQLVRVFVQEEERTGVPKVEWVELTGTTVADGAEGHERLLPPKKASRGASPGSGAF